jgi:hypothetical protein
MGMEDTAPPVRVRTIARFLEGTTYAALSRHQIAIGSNFHQAVHCQELRDNEFSHAHSPSRSYRTVE